MRLRSIVLPGSRVEFTAPGIPEGAEVEITLSIPEPRKPKRRSVLDIVKGRPPSRLTAEDWGRIEREFQEDRDSWDR